MLPIPQPVSAIIDTLESNGFEAFIVGGSVRDMIRNTSPKDWDITTSAKPEEILELFPDSVYENTFGTVGIKHRVGESYTEIIEVTTYRKDSIYEDNRHPKEVSFVTDINDDLSRRDFTINAIALSKDGTIVDPWNGKQDIVEHIIRTVGDPHIRFAEDALRILRAIRFAVELDYTIESNTWEALRELSISLTHISKERIREELTKIIMTPRAMYGFELLRDANLLPHIMPELMEGIGVEQNGHHIYDVWEHLLRTMQHACDKNWSFDLRMAGLLHDIAKPRTKEGQGKTCTFHGHEVVGASMAYEILTRLRYPKHFCGRISKLVRYHMFYYDTGTVTEASVRKLVHKVGKANVKDLIRLRECDRIGSGTPKARPYRLRHFEYMTEKVLADPIDLSMLAIDGHTLIHDLGLKPGPQIGAILNVLLAEVLENPNLNTKPILIERAQNLQHQDLQVLKKEAISTIEAAEHQKDDLIKKKYHVQ